jgi:hypothetical protein
MTIVAYIGGYGQSGTTLLEYLMTGSPAVIACGEVGSSRGERVTAQKKCSCSLRAVNCPVWGPFFVAPQKISPRAHEDLVLALRRQLAGRYGLMVDSSKTAWRNTFSPFKLRRRLGQDFVLVHMTRDPRAVCWSMIKKRERMGSPANGILLCARTTLGWLHANLACELFRVAYPGQYLRIRYEDLVRASPQVLTTLVDRLAPGANWSLEGVDAHANRHQLSGNRMRRQHLSVHDIKEDDAWRNGLPARYRRVISPIAWILRQRYGY